MTGGTTFVRVERRTEAGPTGWPGGFVEVSIGASDVKAGEFVTVAAERAGERLVARKIPWCDRENPARLGPWQGRCAEKAASGELALAAL